MTTALQAVTTQAGYDSFPSGGGSGFELNLTHIAIGDMGEVIRDEFGVPLQSAINKTALNNEIERVEIVSGAITIPNQIDVLAQFTNAPSEYQVYEFGVFDDQNTMVLYWSSDQPLGYRDPEITWTLEFSYAWSDLPANSFNIIFADGGIIANLAAQLAALEARVAQTNVYDIPFQTGFDSEGGGVDLVVGQFGGVVASRNIEVTELVASLQGAPVGASLELDIQVNGTSIYSVFPYFTDGSTVLNPGTLATDPTPINVGDRITAHVLQIGSTTSGQQLYISLLGRIA